MLDVPRHPVPYQQDHPRTMYFRCENCAHIKIVEE